MGKSKLDKYEKEIENNIENFVPVSGKKRRKIEVILEKSRKTKNINIRISESDLEKLKNRAIREGIPYQTLITQILHKYIHDRLVDENDIIKSIELLRRAKITSDAD